MGMFRSLRVFGYSALVYALALTCLALIEKGATTIAVTAGYGALVLAIELAVRWLAVRQANHSPRLRHR